MTSCSFCPSCVAAGCSVAMPVFSLHAAPPPGWHPVLLSTIARAEYDNPYDVGMTGLIGFSSGYRAMEHCDALVMLGTDFPYRPYLDNPDFAGIARYRRPLLGTGLCGGLSTGAMMRAPDHGAVTWYGACLGR
jgi:hypothetical protein